MTTNRGFTFENLKFWIFAFVHGYRYEAAQASKSELRFLEPFVKEQMLAKPCQVEAFQFYRPFRFLLLFFFDSTKKDLLINVGVEHWSSLDLIVEKLVHKYESLKIGSLELGHLVGHCREYPKDLMYSIDFLKNLSCLSFPIDPAEKGSSNPTRFRYSDDPQKIGALIYGLNVNQGSIYS